MAANPVRVPTVDDLRVKLCYICREEERADTPSANPPRAWTHPCSCTLIAHEDCLLHWIQTSQSTPTRAEQALKCPQCGTAYELESKGSALLDVIGAGNKVLQRLGRYFTVFAAAATAGLVGTTVYVCLTAYGAWAVKQFIGTEMFDLILTDDPANWTWQAYVNLPLVPISLILSRFSTSSNMVVPLLLVWPPSTPVGEKSRSLLHYWRMPENHARLTQVAALRSLWPPPPMLFGVFGFPIVRGLYKRLYARAFEALLGSPMPNTANARRGQGAGAGANPGDLQFEDGLIAIRIRANVIQGPAQAAGGEDEDDQQAQQQAAPAPNPDPNVAAIEAAQQIIRVDTASLGRRVAGALLVPAISNFMGSALYALSRHSPLLSAFLGIRHPPLGVSGGKRVPLPPFSLAALAPPHVPWSELTVPQKAKTGLKLIVSAFLGGTRTWVNSDPVWWRNGVGFALFSVAKDCVYLLHLWLAKRELESRRVKNRDFKGVDIAELDLLDSFRQTAA